MIFAGPHEAFDYPIVGTFAAAVSLAVIFALFVNGRRRGDRYPELS